MAVGFVPQRLLHCDSKVKHVNMENRLFWFLSLLQVSFDDFIVDYVYISNFLAADLCVCVCVTANALVNG